MVDQNGLVHSLAFVLVVFNAIIFFESVEVGNDHFSFSMVLGVLHLPIKTVQV